MQGPQSWEHAQNAMCTYHLKPSADGHHLLNATPTACHTNSFAKSFACKMPMIKIMRKGRPVVFSAAVFHCTDTDDVRWESIQWWKSKKAHVEFLRMFK